MKKTVIIEIVLLTAFVLSTVIASRFLYLASTSARSIQRLTELGFDTMAEVRESLYHTTYLPFGLVALFAALADLAAMVIIAVKEFPVFKPLVDKLNAKRAARKEQRAAAKEEKVQEYKQARIDKLTAELEELKKDE